MKEYAGPYLRCKATTIIKKMNESTPSHCKKMCDSLPACSHYAIKDDMCHLRGGDANCGVTSSPKMGSWRYYVKSKDSHAPGPAVTEKMSKPGESIVHGPATKRDDLTIVGVGSHCDGELEKTTVLSKCEAFAETHKVSLVGPKDARMNTYQKATLPGGCSAFVRDGTIVWMSFNPNIASDSTGKAYHGGQNHFVCSRKP